MAEDVSYAQLYHLALINARATVAAALIQSGVADLTGVHFYDQAAAANTPSMTKLKGAVEVVMRTVVTQML